MISIAYLFIPIGFVKYPHEHQGLEENSTYHTSPKSLNRKKQSMSLWIEKFIKAGIDIFADPNGISVCFTK
jgi:hypothetical protein